MPPNLSALRGMKKFEEHTRLGCYENICRKVRTEPAPPARAARSCWRDAGQARPRAAHSAAVLNQFGKHLPGIPPVSLVAPYSDCGEGKGRASSDFQALKAPATESRGKLKTSNERQVLEALLLLAGAPCTTQGRVQAPSTKLGLHEAADAPNFNVASARPIPSHNRTPSEEQDLQAAATAAKSVLASARPIPSHNRTPSEQEDLQAAATAAKSVLASAHPIPIRNRTPSEEQDLQAAATAAKFVFASARPKNGHVRTPSEEQDLQAAARAAKFVLASARPKNGHVRTPSEEQDLQAAATAANAWFSSLPLVRPSKRSRS